MTIDVLAPFDAVLLLSFGGPESQDEVMPFLEHVTRGRGIPKERLTGVAAHYALFGGVSPINSLNREFLAKLEPALRNAGSSVPIFWGNRNSAPWLRDAVMEMQNAGIRRPVVFVTSAYSSYSGCRQYREDLARAFAGTDIEVAKVAQFFDAAGFIAANAEALVKELADAPTGTATVFITHSLPVAADTERYVEQHQAVAHEVVRRVKAAGYEVGDWQLAYCSRSGAPHQPWLEPDVNEVLRNLAAAGVTEVCLAPIGFISDHMEVAFDLDTEAKATANSLNLRMRRAATAGSSSTFIDSVVQLLIERANPTRTADHEPVRVDLGCASMREVCAVDCCPNPREQLPALCGERD